MFYPNYIKAKSIKYKKYKYASFANGLNVDYDENLTPIKFSRNTYNFNYNNGALTSGLGVKDPDFYYIYEGVIYHKSTMHPGACDFVGVWMYPYYRKENTRRERDYPIIICCSKRGELFYLALHSSNTAFVQINDIKLSSIPNIIPYKLNGKDLILIVTEKEGMYTWEYNDGLTKYDSAPIVTSMCIHYERLFVTTSGESTQVWFSDDLDPTNFNTSSTEGGFIELKDERGKSNKVLAFDDYVYVVRDYGFSKISAYGSQDTFSVYHLIVSSGRIFHNTAVVCGDKIMYMSTDGLYMFDGVSTKKLDYNINKLIDPHYNEDSKAVFSNGSYYLLCNLNYPDEDVSTNIKNNTLVKIDLSSGEMTILRTDKIINIASIDDRHYPYTIACAYNKNEVSYTLGEICMSGDIFGEVTHKVWSSPMTDFGEANKYKFIKELTLETKTDITLKVYYDDKVKDIYVKGKDKSQTIRLGIKTKRFRLDFISDEADVYVSNPELMVGVL